MPGTELGRSPALEVVELDAAREPAYEAFVGSHPHALLYHSRRFRDFLVHLLGCRPVYGVALENNEIRGVLPVMSATGPYGRVLNSLPYHGSNGGVLADGPQARAALAGWFDALAASGDVATATVIANPLDAGARPPAHDLSDVRVGCMTPLTGDGDPGDRLLAAVDGSARRNVAKAERSGVRVEVDNGAFAALEELHRAGMVAVGGRAKAPAFFAAVPRCFRAGMDFDLYVARIGDEVAAALLVFFHGSAAEYYVPATRPERRSEQPLAAILRRAMVDAAQRGLAWWNWGGSWVGQESLIRFKAKWGGVPRQYRYWTRVNDPAVLDAGPEELLDAYSGFFVAPFSALRGGRHAAG